MRQYQPFAWREREDAAAPAVRSKYPQKKPRIKVEF